MTRLVGVGIALALLAGCLLTPSTSTELDTGLYAEVLALDGDIAAGELAYDDHCRRCHGRDAGGTLRGVGIAGTEVEVLVETMLTGPGHMPTFDGLDPQDLADIAAYVHDLDA